MLQWAVIGIFGVWLLLSVLVHVPRLGSLLRALDVFYFLPEFRFFAPTPGQHDFHLLYRDQLADGSVTEWTEVEPIHDRKFRDILWNAGKRGNKARLDITVALANHLLDERSTVELSVPYLTLLNHVSGLPRPVAPRYTQFLIMNSQGDDAHRKHEVVVASRLHPL